MKIDTSTPEAQAKINEPDDINAPWRVTQRAMQIEGDQREQANRRRVRAYMNECRAPVLTANLGSYWPES